MSISRIKYKWRSADRPPAHWGSIPTGPHEVRRGGPTRRLSDVGRWAGGALSAEATSRRISGGLPDQRRPTYCFLMELDVLGGFEVGPARERDLDDVVRLLEAADQALDLPTEPMREELLWTWHLPTTNLDRDTRILRDTETVIAYGEAIWKHPEEGGPLGLFVRVHPDYRGAGIGTSLTTWGQRLAYERGAEGVRAFAADRDASAQDLLRSRGYVQVRSSFTMRKDLVAGEDPGTPPPGVSIRRYEDADERVLYEVNQASFAEDWGFSPGVVRELQRGIARRGLGSIARVPGRGRRTDRRPRRVVPLRDPRIRRNSWRLERVARSRDRPVTASSLLRRAGGPRHAGGWARRGRAERPRRRRPV